MAKSNDALVQAETDIDTGICTFSPGTMVIPVTDSIIHNNSGKIKINPISHLVMACEFNTDFKYWAVCLADLPGWYKADGFRKAGYDDLKDFEFPVSGPVQVLEIPEDIEDVWYQADIEKLYQAGVPVGFEDEGFGPRKAIVLNVFFDPGSVKAVVGDKKFKSTKFETALDAWKEYNWLCIG